MYIETSSPRKSGDKAWFLSPQYPAAPNGKCLNFWYHMSGSHIGTMNVYIKDGLTIGTKVWNETGDQGNFWLHARAPIKINNKFQVGCLIHAFVSYLCCSVSHLFLVFNISRFSLRLLSKGSEDRAIKATLPLTTCGLMTARVRQKVTLIFLRMHYHFPS